jgi:hypothetical protein
MFERAAEAIELPNDKTYRSNIAFAERFEKSRLSPRSAALDILPRPTTVGLQIRPLFRVAGVRRNRKGRV